MNKTIYLIDDDMDILTILRLFFEKENYNVITDYNGYMLNLNQTDKPAIYLIDVNLLDRKSGLQLCKTLKNTQQDVPVILMSANINSQKTAVACGADAFISKPFNMEEVLISVNRLIENYA